MCRLQNARFIHQNTQYENLAKFHFAPHESTMQRPRYGLRKTSGLPSLRISPKYHSSAHFW